MNCSRILWLENNQTLSLKSQEVCIGRKSTCTICLPSTMSAASSVHCTIRQDDTGRYTVIDSSANGTYLNPDSQNIQNCCRIKRGQCVALSVGDVIGVTVGYGADGCVKLTRFRLESVECSKVVSSDQVSKEIEQDEETCADLTLQTNHPVLSLALENAAFHAVNHHKLGCKRPRDICSGSYKRKEETEVLEVARSKAVMRANQLQAEADKLNRAAEHLAAKLDTAR